MDFVCDGCIIVFGSGDCIVRFWDIEIGLNMVMFIIEDGVIIVVILFDVKYVVVGLFDKSVRVWDVKIGFLLECFEGFEGYKDSVYFVVFLFNFCDFVSGSLDKIIKMWEFVVFWNYN